MAKLEDILKSRGWTEQELADSPLLKDARFRADLEASVGAVEADAHKYKTEAERWADWREKEANPAIVAAEDDARKARLEAARSRELLEIAKEYGYVDDEKVAKHRQEHGNPNPDNRIGQPPANFDESKFVTRDFANQFAMGQGKAMAQYVSIAGEHQRLFGKPIEDFDQVYDDFLNVSPLERGKVTLKDMWERRYKVPEKRAEIQAAERAAHDQKIREEAIRETESKYAMQRANPMLAIPQQSRQPFIPAVPKEGGQPWEQNRGAMKSRRVENATKTQLESSRVN